MGKILIVDDKTENLYLLQSLLDTSDFETITAKNGDEALELARKDNPDLIISDILMPVMDGFTLCRECKNDKDLENIPFFFYTATYTDSKDEEYALSLGAERFIRKPMEPDDLIEIINEFFKSAGREKSPAKKPVRKPESVVLKEYNEVLVRKIEHKMLQAEKAEKKIREYAEKLEKEISERKKNEASLEESKLLFQTLANVSPVGIFRTNLDGDTTFVNPKWCEMAGISQEKALGKAWLKAVHPEDREMLSEKWSADSGKRLESTAEYRFLKPDGSVVWVLGNAVPEIVDNSIIGYVGTITDITEIKLSENMLKSSEERFKIIYDHAPDAYYLSDLKGNFVDGNIAAEKLLGYKRNELIGKSFLKLNLLSGKELLLAGKLLIKNSLGQSSGPDTFTLTRKDKSKVTVEIITHPVKIENRTFVLGIARDITERKKMEEKIIESETYYRTLFEGANEAIFIMSGDTFIECNEKTLSMFGCSKKEDIINHYPWEFSPAIQPDGSDSKEKAAELIKTVLAGTPQRFYWKHLKKSGEPFDAEVSLNRIELGEKIFIQALVTDISDRKKAEEDLIMAKEKAEESDRLKTAFLHNISHEIRTPMNAIVGFSALLSEPGLDNSSRQSYIETICQSSDQLLTIVSDIIEISNIEAGIIKINKTDVNVNSVLKRIYDQFTPKASEKGITFTFDTPLNDSEAVINTDKTKLVQILTNLVNNALIFTSKGQIDFGYVVKKEDIEFYVSDTGIGINEELYTRIFDRFYQVESKVSRQFEGTGLGLSICKAYVEFLGGKIWLSSEVGKGSVFYFTLPFTKSTPTVKDEEKAISREKVTKELKEKKTSGTILIAEDEINNYLLLVEMLSSFNAEIIHAVNGKEAVGICQEKKIDLVIMDIKMPVMDGYTATKEIKKFLPDLPVIALTAYAYESDRDEAINSGCNDYLAKPVLKIMLQETVKKYL